MFKILTKLSGSLDTNREMCCFICHEQQCGSVMKCNMEVWKNIYFERHLYGPSRQLNYELQSSKEKTYILFIISPAVVSNVST